ncbi:MAG: pilus assembly protein PilM [Clostridiales bacterium]|nr:pilus assembly protein PilM [Clostridiales bacterium]
MGKSKAITGKSGPSGGSGLIGVDIGSAELRMALVKNGSYQIITERLPENVVKGGHIMAPEQLGKLIHSVRGKAHMTAGGGAVILPDFTTYFRRISMPPMSVEQLKINLPYEFRDYIGGETDKYFFDYAMERTLTGDDGLVTGLEMAAAVQKTTIEEYMQLFRKAGLRLALALPYEMVYVNIMRQHVQRHPEAADKEFCLVELGYDSSRVVIMKGAVVLASKVIEIGCRQVDTAIADTYHIDRFVAADYRRSNHDNALASTGCISIYDQLSVEVMKVINFHIYNNRDSQLTDIYFCGGGAAIALMTGAITQAVQFTAHPMAELLPAGTGASPEELAECAMAVGIALKTEG